MLRVYWFGPPMMVATSSATTIFFLLGNYPLGAICAFLLLVQFGIMLWRTWLMKKAG